MTELPNPAPYPINPLSEAFPRSRRARYASLVVRISEYGFRPAVLVWNGEIIYGLELLQAYAEAGVEPRFKNLPDEADPLFSIVAEAIPSQEMDNNERAVSACLLYQWSKSERTRAELEKCANLRTISQQEAADIYGVLLRLVSYAFQVLSEDSTAVPALQQAVKEWTIKASAAAKILERPAEVQERAVDLVRNGKFRSVQRAADQVERDIAQQERAKKGTVAMSHRIRDVVTLHQAAVEDLHAVVPAASVDAVITKMAHTKNVMATCVNLVAFALHALNDSGVLVVVGLSQNLQVMMSALFDIKLPLVDEFDVAFDGPPLEIPDLRHDIAVSRLPALVYGKPGFRPVGLNNRLVIPEPNRLPPGLNREGMTFEELTDTFTFPGHVVCNPAMGGEHWAALAGWRNGCQYIGADATERQVAGIWAKLDDAEARLDIGSAFIDENPAPGQSGNGAA